MSSSVNDFTVSVRGGEAVPGRKDYASLRDGQEFAIVMRNGRSTPADAELTIDDTIMGKWRVPAFQSVSIERPQSSARKFTFLKEGTSRALKAGVPTGDEQNGLVTVTFTPEMPSDVRYAGLQAESGLSLESVSPAGYSSGGTALGAASQQTFGSTAALRNIDAQNITTVNLRLVVKNAEPELVSVRQLSNAVPPRWPN